MNKIIPYIKLMRPANLFTAVADIMFGFAASGVTIKFLYEGDKFFIIENINSLYALILSTIGLYGGGVVFNDVFDAELDRIERPERPIPSGRVSLTGAIILGSRLLFFGVWCAFIVSIVSGFIATFIAILALTYDSYSKNHEWLGPLNMGACRSGNLLLGISIMPMAISKLWFLGLIPIIYIGAITLISRGEVNGMSKKAIENGLLLYVLMLLGIFNLAFLDAFNFMHSLPFVLLFVLMTIPTWIAALKNADPLRIRKAVKTGVLALIILDASLAAGFAGIEFGILILVLLPLSIIIAKKFAVT
jgi:4-hydroxybenzoate polyprenyltransferase